MALVDRIDCQPDGGDQSECESRGCIWHLVSPPGGAPRCYLDTANSGYTLTQISGDVNELTRISNTSSMFGGDMDMIKVVFEGITNSVLRIKIYTDGRYEVPVNISRDTSDSPVYDVQHPTDTSSGEQFYIKVIRKDTGTVIWDTSIGGLVFAEQFLQLVTKVPSNNVYGFGENRHFQYKHDFSYKTWPMFSRDQAPGWGDYGNLYGVHPYYLCVEDDGKSHGVLLLNSNAMEVTMLPVPAITYRTVGGILDFYIILGDNPEHVTEQYTQLIGRPYLPAYWSLGFQLCRYGYENIENMKAAVDRTIAANIPYDVQYGDIDHFIDNKIFTWDSNRFPGLPDYFEELRTKGIKIIIILDPFVLGTDPEYEIYNKAGDIFVKWPANIDHPDNEKFNSTNMYGYVWPPGPAVFPDFFNPDAQEWWKQCIKDYRPELVFDGLWIDMNEPANFGTNEDKPWNWPENSPEDPWSLKCPTSDLDDPPYKPKSVFGPRLSEKTLCMVGEHTDQSNTFSHYDVHSLYGWSHIKPTLEALVDVTSERGIVISRSTYPSSGTMAGHWLGDNDSSWQHLRDSIIGILEFNLFGIPYIGADICGYFNDVTPQLCQRWMQVGAFYSYSRNHNGRNYQPQDPAVFGPVIAESSRKALEVRYTLLPYLYTLFYRAHVDGSSVLRPLLHEFVSDPDTYDIDRQFMWGSGLLISPVLEENAVTVDAYFPEARWFDYYTGAEVAGTGMYQTLDAPLDYIPVHTRGGLILPTQQPANNTHFSRQNPFGLIISPDADGKANGELFWDDGVSVGSVEDNKFHLFQYQLSSDVITMTTTTSHGLQIPELTTIRLFGALDKPTNMSLTVDGPPQIIPLQDLFYHPITKELFITNLDIAQTSAGWSITITY